MPNPGINQGRIAAGNRSRESGFTLIELLVVLAIVCILAAILFPVFARARERGRSAGCESNLHQIGLAALQYTQDNDERLFGALVVIGTVHVYWQTRLEPYLQNTSIFVCPSENVELYQGPVFNVELGSYCYNSYYLDDPQGEAEEASGQLLSSIADPVNTVIFSERTNAAAGSPRYICLPFVSDDFPSTPHFNGANAAFLDGHVKWFPSPGTLFNSTLLWTGNG